MKINQLPVDLIYRIMKFALFHIQEFAIMWKYAFPVIQCCRYWRMVGIPIVYKYLYVNDRQDNTIRSNASFIAGINDETVAKTAILCFGRCMDITKVMQAVCNDLITNNRGNWKTIRKLHVHVGLSNIPYVEGLSPYDTMLDELCRHINHFSMLVPNVVKLDIRLISDRKLDSLCAGEFVANYAKQLTYLQGISPGCSEEPLYMHSIRHLDFFWHPDKQLCALQVDASLITKISLCLVPCGFSWDFFAGTRSAEPIVFSCLKDLAICFNMNNSLLSQPRLDLWKDNIAQLSRVSFPKLESLEVNACVASAVMLKSATLPQKLKLFRIDIDDDMRIICKDITLNTNTCNRLHAALNPINNQGCSFITAQMAFGIDDIAQNIKADINSIHFIERNHEFMWPNLRKICITGAVQPENTFSIFQKFPSITQLQFDRLRTNNLAICSIANMLRCREWSGLTPYNTNINKLVLCAGTARGALMAAFYVYIAIRLPNLKEMIISDDYFNEFEKCKSKWQSEYPHLSSIKLIDIRKSTF